MKSHEEVEATLERLGNAWPPDHSLVDRVRQGLESAPRVPPDVPRSRWVHRLAACATVAAVVAVVGWLLRPADSLFAQVRSAVHRARTFQMVVTEPAQGDKPAQTVLGFWCERGVGFREESPTEINIGNTRGTWRHRKSTRIAVQSNDNTIREMVDHVLDDSNVGRLRKDGQTNYERLQAGDQEVDGQPCQAYLLNRTAAEFSPELRDGKRRLVFLVDGRSRILRIRNEVRSGDGWAVQYLHDWKYDVPIDRALFEPRFGDAVALLDIDAAFEKFVDPGKAVHREERSGLIYAIHHVERFENGGIFLISSVRGTEETLQKYPLKRERWNSGTTRVTGPATNYYGSQEYRIPGFEVELASLDHQGIHVSWRVLVPQDPLAKDPFDAGSGQVKILAGISPTGGEFGKANFQDAQGVLHYLTWELVLDVPRPDALPSLETIVRQAYADCTALDGVHFKYLNMGHRGMRPAFLSDLRKITAADFYAAVMEDIGWWRAGCPDDRRVRELRGEVLPPVQ